MNTKSECWQFWKVIRESGFRNWSSWKCAQNIQRAGHTIRINKSVGPRYPFSTNQRAEDTQSEPVRRCSSNENVRDKRWMNQTEKDCQWWFSSFECTQYILRRTRDALSSQRTQQIAGTDSKHQTEQFQSSRNPYSPDCGYTNRISHYDQIKCLTEGDTATRHDQKAFYIIGAISFDVGKSWKMDYHQPALWTENTMSTNPLDQITWPIRSIAVTISVRTMIWVNQTRHKLCFMTSIIWSASEWVAKW